MHTVEYYFLDFYVDLLSMFNRRSLKRFYDISNLISDTGGEESTDLYRFRRNPNNPVVILLSR